MRKSKNANSNKIMSSTSELTLPRVRRKKTSQESNDSSLSPSSVPDLPELAVDTEKEASLIVLGERLRSIRNGLGMTLADAARVTGTGASTLSKIELGQMSPTYDMLQKIVRGLKIDIVDLFDAREHQRPAGRRDLTRSGAGRPLKTPRYEHELLATQLSHKKFVPFRSKITARVPVLNAIDSADNETSHAGEEFFYVLSGAVQLHTDSYEPVLLESGDSVYFDSGMRHAVISVSEEDAMVLWVASHA